MAVKVIPEGSNAVVTEDACHGHLNNTIAVLESERRRRDYGDYDYGHGGRHHGYDDHDVELMGAIRGAQADIERNVGLQGTLNISATKDAQADIERNVGLQGTLNISATKDAQADIERGVGLHGATNLGAIKEARADLERSIGEHGCSNLLATKDAQADIERGAGLHFGETVKTLKDVEAGVERAAGFRHADTVKTLKDVESELMGSDCKTRDRIREAELAVERSKARLVELIKDTQLEACKNTDIIKDEIKDARRELLLSQTIGFKDTLVQFKEADIRAFKLAAEAEKTAFLNQRELLLQFKDTQCQAERLAAQASKELAECCCEMKMLVKEEGQLTRALITQQEIDRLKERAAKAEQSLAFLQLKCCPEPCTSNFPG